MIGFLRCLFSGRHVLACLDEELDNGVHIHTWFCERCGVSLLDSDY